MSVKTPSASIPPMFCDVATSAPASCAGSTPSTEANRSMSMDTFAQGRNDPITSNAPPTIARIPAGDLDFGSMAARPFIR